MSPARSKFGTGTSGPGNATSAGTPSSARRNRAAVRDYHNLKPTATAGGRGSSVGAASTTSSETTTTTTTTTTDNGTEEGEGGEGEGGPNGSGVRASALDRPGFDAAAHVAGVLEREGLAGVLRAEATLLNEMRELDGERKALVYDNYSKLIAATDTIRRLRLTMLPPQQGNRELQAMVDEIAGTVGELSDATAASAAAVAAAAADATAATARTGGDVDERTGIEEEDGVKERKEEELKLKQKRKATVRWVIESPSRLAGYMEARQREKAEEEWKVVQGLLDKWKGTDGVEEVRQRCLAAMKDESE